MVALTNWVGLTVPIGSFYCLFCFRSVRSIYVNEVLLHVPQDAAFSDPTQDVALGQLVVLLQYNWPREEERFASIITAIQKRKKFSIADYLPYIIGILT